MEVNNQELEKNFITTTVDKFLNIARSNSIWPLSCGLACCSMEMMAAAAARFDLSRLQIPQLKPIRQSLIHCFQ